MFEYYNYYGIDPLNIVPVTDTNDVVRYEDRNGRWYIRMHYAGFNTPANNGSGYATREQALAVTRKFQAKR